MIVRETAETCRIVQENIGIEHEILCDKRRRFETELRWLGFLGRSTGASPPPPAVLGLIEKAGLDVFGALEHGEVE